MYSRLSVLISVAMLLVVVTAAHAQSDYIAYFPNCRLQLGETTYKSDPTKAPALKPIEFKPAESALMTPQGNFSMLATATRKQTLSAMGLQASIAYRGFGVDAYAGVSLDESASEDSQEVSLVLRYLVDHGTMEIQGNPTPRNDNAVIQLKKSFPNDFYNLVGTHYVSKVQMGSSIAVALTWSAQNALVRKEAKANGNLNAWGAGLKHQFQQEFVNAAKQKALDIKVVFAGRDGELLISPVLDVLNTLAKDNASFDDVITSVKAIITASLLNARQKPIPIGFHIAPLPPVFGENVGVDPLDAREMALEQIFHNGRRCKRLLDRIGDTKAAGGAIDPNIENETKAYLVELATAHETLKAPGVGGKSIPAEPTEPLVMFGQTQFVLFQHPEVRKLLGEPTLKERFDKLTEEIKKLRATSWKSKTELITITAGKVSGTYDFDFGAVEVDRSQAVAFINSHLEFKNPGHHEIKIISITAKVVNVKDGKVTVEYKAQMTDGDANTAEGNVSITVMAAVTTK